MPGTKNFLCQLLYFLCIAVPYFNIYELTFMVWVIAAGLTLKTSYPKVLLQYLGLFSVILGIAVISGLLRGHTIFAFIRDFTYVAKPIVGLLAGYQLSRFNSDRAFKLIIYTAVAIASVHFVIILFTFIKYRTVTVNILRYSGGYFSDYEVYAVIILLFYEKFKIQMSKKRARLLLLIVGVSSFLYLARTNLIQFVILYVGMKGYLKLNRKSGTVLLSLILAGLLGYGAILYINPKRGGKGLEAFLYKIKIAPIEPFKTKIDKENWKDFNDNYRSYENIIAVRQISGEGTSAVLFGEGLGSTLDLGRRVLSNDGGYVRHIPVVHNGYMTVLLKSGLAGVVLLLVFIYMLIRQKKSSSLMITNINYLLTASGIFLIVSNWVFLGFYFKMDTKSVFIGFLLGLRHMIGRMEAANTKPELNAEN